MTDRFKIRRRFAISAFISIVVSLFTILAMAYFGDSTIGGNLNSVTGILTPIILCLTGVVAQYAHLVFKSDSVQDSAS